jgi:hypothetical protein
MLFIININILNKIIKLHINKFLILSIFELKLNVKLDLKYAIVEKMSCLIRF